MWNRLDIPARVVAGLLGGCALAASAEGLRPPAGGFWSAAPDKWHLSAQWIETPRALSSFSLDGAAGVRPLGGGAFTGDYFFQADADDAAAPRSGFRASSGLLFRPAGMSTTELALSSRAAAGFGGTSRMLASALPGWPNDAQGASISALPYVGLGYSALWPKTGWGFWADVGMVVQSPGGALGLGRVIGGSLGVDDLMRELRLAPMLQLGVNYAF